MKIEKDKTKHLAVSFVLCLAVGAYNLPLGILITTGIGIAKEVYDDRSGKGTPDIYDIVANFIGILIASAIVIISNSL